MIPKRQWLLGYVLLTLVAGMSAALDDEKPVKAPQAPRTQPLHDGAVQALAFSPDGRLLASGGADHTVRLWDIATGREVRRCEGHKAQVKALAFAPDGQMLASGSNDPVVSLWDPATGAKMHDCRGHEFCVSSLGFSADGRTLASGDYEGSARTWDTRTGKELRSFEAHHGAISGVALSSDGRKLVTAGYDSLLRTWDLVSGKPVNQVQRVRRGEVLGVAYCARGRWLVSTAANGTLARTTDDAEDVELWGRDMRSAILAVSADGKTMAVTSTMDGVSGIALYETATWREICRFEIKEVASSVPGFSAAGDSVGVIKSIALSSASGYLAVGTRDGYIHVWRLIDLVEARKTGPITERNLEKCWTDLASTDARTAYGAAALLAAQPESAIPLLRARLTPEPPLDVARVHRLLRSLGDDDFDVREKASAELLKTLPRSEEILRTAFKKEQDLEIHLRIGRLVAALEEPPLSTDRARLPRTLMALENMGTAEARTLLQTLAGRQGEPLLVEDARAVLARLSRRR